MDNSGRVERKQGFKLVVTGFVYNGEDHVRNVLSEWPLDDLAALIVGGTEVYEERAKEMYDNGDRRGLVNDAMAMLQGVATGPRESAKYHVGFETGQDTD